MPTETTIAARRADGAEIFYHDSPYFGNIRHCSGWQSSQVICVVDV